MTVTLGKAPFGTVPSHEATVYMPTPMHQDAIVYAQQRFKDLLFAGPECSEEECLARADAILLRVGKMGADKISKAPKLQIISRNGTGVDSIDRQMCEERGIVVTNQPGGNAQSVAELCLTLALMLLRRVKEINERIRGGEVIPSIQALAPGLWGKTVGLIGMGDIAQETAKIFSDSFNCKILVYSPTSSTTRWTYSHPTDPVIPHSRCSSLEELLPQIDILSIHCPKLPSTHNLISKVEFALMKPTAVLINTARGGIVDEVAMEEALLAGRLGGAGLDVWEEEPPRLERYMSLLEMPNVVGLPHLGGSTDEVTKRGCMNAVDEVANWLDGKGVKNRVF